MVITSGIQYRNFAGQNEFCFSFDAINSTSSGNAEIGFSGDQGVLPIFSLKNGGVFDSNNKYVWSYNPREIVSFSGNVGSGYINYFVNDTPVCLFSPKNNNFYYDSFYIKTTGSEIEYNFYIRGDKPNYNIIFPPSTVWNQNLVGFIKNTETVPGKSFKIFSGALFSENTNYVVQNLPVFTISGNQSGQIILKPGFNENINLTNVTPSQANLFLSTSFGDILNTIFFDLIPAPVYLIDLITGYSGPLGLVSNFTLQQFYNFELRTIYPEPLEVNIFIKNVSGHTGQLIFGELAASGFVDGEAAGFIYGFDYITGTLTGNGQAFLERDYYGQFPTGTLLNNYREFQYATGDINYIYELPLLGGSGTGKSPEGTIILTTGFLDSPLSGFVYGYGRILNEKNIDLTGFYFDSPNVETITRNLTGSGYYTGSYALYYNKLLWKSNNITGVNYSGFSDKIVGINGSSFGNLTPNNLGQINFGKIISNQSTGVLLNPIINQSLDSFVNSGSGFASENNSLSENAFIGNDYFYLTGLTGDMGIFFKLFEPQSKNKISFYSFELDFNTLKYPYNFDLQLSTNRSGPWSTIDNRSGDGLFLRGEDLNFYEYPKQIILECNNPDELINDNASYNYARILIKSGEVWPHNFTGEKSSNGIGLRKFELFGAKPVAINNLEPFSAYNVAPNLTGYNKPSGNFLRQNSFSGEVFYSNDSLSYPAWYAFNENKNAYPYAEISGNVDNDLFLGYSVTDNFFDFTGFNIEFENGFIPTGVILQFSRDGNNYNTIYENNSNIEESLNLNFDIITGCKSLKFLFNNILSFNSSSSSSSSSVGCSVIPPEGVDINSACYAEVIQDTYCCDIEWDASCANAYLACIEQ